MDNDLIMYIDRLEVMAFFAGYPLIYTLIYLIGGGRPKEDKSFSKRLLTLLPFSYALTGTLFLGLLLKNIFPGYSIKNIAEQFQNPYLKIWALSAILFWIPAFSKRPVFSFLHSLPFFYLLARDVFLYIISGVSIDVVMNDMKINTDSILINTCTLAFVLLIHFALTGIRNYRNIFFNRPDTY